jgi:hypothetical protein
MGIASAPLIGDRVAGRYALVSEAARGGMGTVFRARDHRDRRDVALKVLRAADATSVARFEREAAILAEVRHPNVVAYLGHGATPDGVRYLVMEWVEGQTLAHRLAHEGLTMAELVGMAIQLCRGLAALHERGIVHRDIKPSNVMLVGGEVAQVKLVDLGIARRVGDLGQLTQTGAVVGTAGYLAPEQLRGPRAVVDGRADLFALGCVLHEGVAGAPLFRGDSTLAVCAKVLLHDPPSLAGLAPAALAVVVDQLLARPAADRPASAAEVERQLAALVDLPATRHRAAAARIDATRTAGPVFGVLVIGAPDALAWRPDDSRLRIAPFDAGLAIEVAGRLADAVRVARAIAALAPAARIVIAAEDPDATWVDRGARLHAELTLAHRIAGTGARGGVWIARGGGATGSEEVAVVEDGRFLRLCGPAEGAP